LLTPVTAIVPVRAFAAGRTSDGKSASSWLGGEPRRERCETRFTPVPGWRCARHTVLHFPGADKKRGNELKAFSSQSSKSVFQRIRPDCCRAGAPSAVRDVFSLGYLHPAMASSKRHLLPYCQLRKTTQT
jgi:hypothetical protein